MLSKQNQSRLEETKVEKRNEDEEYLRKHPEIAAAFRVISRVGCPFEYLFGNDKAFVLKLILSLDDSNTTSSICKLKKCFVC